MDDEQFLLLEKAVEASLTAMSSSVREQQAGTTLKYIAPLWPGGPMVDDLVRHLIELCCQLGTSIDSSEAWYAVIRSYQ